MRPTKGTQDKLEAILKSQGYVVRYEKGSFRGGHCVVLFKKTVVINKFFPIEGIIQALSEVIYEIDIDTTDMEEELVKLAEKVKQRHNEEESHELEDANHDAV